MPADSASFGRINMPLPLEFVFFGLTLAGVALFHKRALFMSLAGLSATGAPKVTFTGFKGGAGLNGLVLHFVHEWVMLANLMLLLVGFAILAHHFEKSNLPHALPRLLPHGWQGGVVLLAIVFCMSAFLDNIAAAVIGGVVARHVYADKVNIGFLVSIVAAANAGGTGSVIGDTTTTMMWLAGIPASVFFKAFIGAAVAVTFFGIIAAKVQHAFQAIVISPLRVLPIDTGRIAIVALVIILTVVSNIALEA